MADRERLLTHLDQFVNDFDDLITLAVRRGVPHIDLILTLESKTEELKRDALQALTRKNNKT